MSADADVRRIRMGACIGAFVLALASIACGGGGAPSHPPADVSGWYVRDIDGGREVIDIRPNGAYVHVITVQGAPARADEARWHAAGDSTVTLSSFRDAASVGHGAPSNDSVRAAIHPAPEGELRIELPGDTASFLRRLRYGKQRGG